MITFLGGGWGLSSNDKTEFKLSTDWPLKSPDLEEDVVIPAPTLPPPADFNCGISEPGGSTSLAPATIETNAKITYIDYCQSEVESELDVCKYCRV
jgi:hypothetical protein